MKKNWLNLILLSALLLSACGLAGPAPSATPTSQPATETPLPSPTPPPPTDTPQPTATQPPTATLAPTDTLQPLPVVSSTSTSAPAATAAPVTSVPSVTPSRTPKGFIPTNTRAPAPTAGPSQTPTAVEADIVGVTWYWTSLIDSGGTKITPDDPDRYTLLLKPDGTVSVHSDCNTAAGTYTVRGKKLTIDFRTGSDKDCGDDSDSDLFITSVENASRYDRYDGDMQIFLVDGGSLGFSD